MFELFSGEYADMAVDRGKENPAVKSRIAGLLLAGLILLVLGLANLPYQYVEVEGRWVGSLTYERVQDYHAYQAMPRIAGWPLNYWVQYDQDEVAQDRYWSTTRLISNLAIAGLASWLTYASFQFRRRYTTAGNHRKRNKVLFDVAVAVAVLGVPSLIIGLYYRAAREHRAVAQQLARVGTCYVSCWLPEIMVDHIPRGWSMSFLRLRQVYTVSSNPSVEQYVTKLPTLVALGCLRGQFDLSSLENLQSNVHFGGLQLNAFDLTEANVDSISQLRQLVYLDLSECELDTAMLLRCGQPQLRALRVDFSPLQLSELNAPVWSNTIEDLSLTRPLDRGDTLKIQGWPKLRRLSVKRLTPRRNTDTLKIHLSDLPRLRSLHLNRLQKHHLVLRNVPRLSAVHDGIAELRFVIRTDDLVPGLTWLSGLEIDGAPSLVTIGCFARDLQSLSIRNTPNLKEARIGSFKTSLMSDMSLEKADPSLCQQFIEEIGRGRGPGIVDLTGLPLRDATLSPLVSNRWIRHLRLGGTGVTFRQLQDLAGMGQLESLDIRSCQLKQDELSWLLQRFPKLQKLMVDGKDLSNVQLTSGLQLKEFRTTRLENLERIRIVGLPRLRSRLRLSQSPRQLIIQDAQSLRGLALEAPWPKDSQVSGLRDLEWFAGGGQQIDDELVDALLNCRRLDQLILAYPSISRERLCQLGQLNELTLLSVPGAEVDDAVTDNWRRLKSLREINLDDTAVSVRTLAWLSSIQPLRSVSLNRCSLDDAGMDALSELGQLSELRLAGVDLDFTVLKPLLSAGNLEALDLSGCQLGESELQILCRGFSLKKLVLHDCDVDRSILEQLLAANPLLYVDVGGSRKGMTEKMADDLEVRAEQLRRFSFAWRDATRMNDSLQFTIVRESPGKGYPSPEDSESSIVEEPIGSIDPQAYRQALSSTKLSTTESLE